MLFSPLIVIGQGYTQCLLLYSGPGKGLCKTVSPRALADTQSWWREVFFFYCIQERAYSEKDQVTNLLLYFIWKKRRLLYAFGLVAIKNNGNFLLQRKTKGIYKEYNKKKLYTLLFTENLVYLLFITKYTESPVSFFTRTLVIDSSFTYRDEETACPKVKRLLPL